MIRGGGLTNAHGLTVEYGNDGRPVDVMTCWKHETKGVLTLSVHETADAPFGKRLTVPPVSASLPEIAVR